MPITPTRGGRTLGDLVQLLVGEASYLEQVGTASPGGEKSGLVPRGRQALVAVQAEFARRHALFGHTTRRRRRSSSRGSDLDPAATGGRHAGQHESLSLPAMLEDQFGAFDYRGDRSRPSGHGDTVNAVLANFDHTLICVVANNVFARLHGLPGGDKLEGDRNGDIALHRWKDAGLAGERESGRDDSDSKRLHRRGRSRVSLICCLRCHDAQ